MSITVAAPELFSDTASGVAAHHLGGRLHRLDGPAVVWPGSSREWFVNDVRHRADGPAVEREDGTGEYWVNGERLCGREALERSPDRWFAPGDRSGAAFAAAVRQALTRVLSRLRGNEHGMVEWTCTVPDGGEVELVAAASPQRGPIPVGEFAVLWSVLGASRAVADLLSTLGGSPGTIRVSVDQGGVVGVVTADGTMAKWFASDPSTLMSI